MNEDRKTAPDASGTSPVPEASVPSAREETTVAPPVAEQAADDSSGGRGSSRRGWTIALWVLAGVVLVTAVTLAVIGFQRTSIQRAASEDLSEASRLVERADETVVAVDAVVRASIDATVGQEATSLLGDVEGASDDLNAAIAIIGDVKDDLAEDEARQAEALADSAEARLRMLEHAIPILEASAMVAASLDPADTAMDVLVEAETLSDRAVKEYNKLTKASVKKSKDLASQSEEKVKEAKTHFEEAEKAYPSADFASYEAYCDEKIAVLALSKKAD
ncbi:MAG: hypothetical protein OEV43_06920, partial [Coriobacteriia bacterium]|nr:hypothetical protein [Coriobacteriia bacterium]